MEAKSRRDDTILTLDKRSAVGGNTNRQHQTTTNMTKHLSIQKLLAALLTIAAIATWQTARAADVTLSEDNDFAPNEAGHWYVNMPARTTDHLTLSADDLTACGYTFKVYDDGGKNGNYSLNCLARLAITVPQGYAFMVTGTLWNQHDSSEDYLQFIKGDNTYDYIGGKWYSDTDGEPKTVGPVTCDNNIMSIQFKSNTTGTQYAGFDLTVTVVDVNTDFAVSISTPAHGTLTVDKTTAKLGETIIVTPTPNTEFSTTEVSYTAGTTKYVINPVNNVYSFTMPACDVSVDAVFMDEMMALWGGADVDGSEEHPYIISDQAGWDLLSNKSSTNGFTNGLYFRLDTDLVNVTQALSYFYGHLDGNHHTISINMTHNGNGLINYGSGCTITNLTVEGSIDNAFKNVGGFVAQSPATNNTITLTNCRSSVTITSTYSGTDHHCGGFVGNAYNVECVSCVFDGAFVSSTAYGFSGLVGRCTQLSVTDCAVVFGSATSLTNQQGGTFSFAECSQITQQGHNFYFNKGNIHHIISSSGGTPVYPLTLTKPAAAVRTSGTLIGNGSATVYADGFTLIGDEYYATGTTVTLSPPVGILVTAAHYNDGSDHAATINPDGTATFTMPAANTTATATSFAAHYIDADGTEQTHAVSLLSSSEETVYKVGDWYAVTGEVTLNNGLDFSSAAHLILTDGATLNVKDHFVNNFIDIAVEATDLNIYGQTFGTGTLNAEIRVGVPYSANQTYYAYAIKANASLVFCGGQVNAMATCISSAHGSPAYGSSHCYGIYAEGSVNIIRGNISASAKKEGHPICSLYDIQAAGGVLLDWHRPTDRICLTAATNACPDLSPVSVAQGKALWNGTEVLSGTIFSGGRISSQSDINMFNGKTLQPCIPREVAGYGESSASDHWAFIASPVTTEGGIAPTTVGGLTATTATEYDLYRFNQSANKEWENYKAHSSDFNLVNGQGYLYATKETKTLAFMGEAFNMGTEDVEVPLVYDEGKPLAGWNLVGNPFAVEAYVNRPFYKMNDGGTAIEPVDITQNPEPIAVGTGIMVQAEGANDSVIFSKPTRHGSADNHGGLRLALLSGTEVIDNAILSFNEGSKLGKFYFGEQNANIYIPQGNEEYAIVSVGNTGEIPVNFKANENGTYTISVDVDNVNLAYLHLIDNMTGADVDLLVPELVEGPASYTFTAKTTDYESRFKLVFAVGSSTGSDTFAFINNGNIIVNGEGTLQVFDVLGHQLVTKQLSTLNSKLSTLNYKSGVYVLRLINGENVRTQKIVIE